MYDRKSLTYENMYGLLQEYFVSLPQAVPDTDPNTRQWFLDCFAPGFVNRRGDPVILLSGQEWVDFLFEGAPVRWILSAPKDVPVGVAPWIYNPDPKLSQSPWYFAVDERKRMGFAFLTEQIVDSKSGEIYDEFYVNVHWGFTMHNGLVKFAWEMIVRSPSLYELDVLPGKAPHPAKYVNGPDHSKWVSPKA